MDKIISENIKLLLDTFEKLTGKWRLAVTWSHVASEFELELAMNGIFWPPHCEDEENDERHKIHLVRNFLTSSRRRPDLQVKYKKLGQSKYSRADKCKAVAMQQHVLAENIVALQLKSHRYTVAEDETAFTATGNLLGYGHTYIVYMLCIYRVYIVKPGARAREP